MNFLAILALAMALAMDAFAVAVATGVRLGTVSNRQMFRLAFHFGLFQFFMPVAGWFMGLTVRDFIEIWDHWAAFGLLSCVGLNMLRETFFPRAEEAPADENSPHPFSHGKAQQGPRATDPTKGLSLVMLSVATSIDALAVGLSFAMLNMSVWFPSAVIGVLCCAITAFGLMLGKSLGRAEAFAQHAELVGGLVLLAIGFKILFEHGVFG